MQLTILVRSVFFGFILLTLAACSGSTTETDISFATNHDVSIDTPTGSNGFVAQKNGAATLDWTPPTENTDGSSIIDLSGYRIYYGLSPSSLTKSIIINSTGITTYMIENLNANTTYYFSITAINSSNVESAYSKIISKKTASG